MFSTVNDSSRIGYMLYDYDYSYETTQLNKKDVKINFTNDAFSNAINGNWYGSACVFELPRDSVALAGQFAGQSIKYTNIRVHYEYTGFYNGCNDNPYINTTATYTHTIKSIKINTAIGIDLEKKPSITFDPEVKTSYEKRTISFPDTIKLNV